MKHIVLVTAIGTVTASTIIKELKKTDDYYILGSDINNQNEIATSLDVDEYYKFPLATNDAYLPFILDFCNTHKVEYYYAVIDKEVVLISKNRDKFSNIGTILCVANYDFIKICHFKNVFNDWIGKHIPEIAIKTYKDLEHAEKASYPLFIKPVEGVASNGCRKINSFEELLLVTDADQIGRDVIVQDYIEGQNITVDCIRNKKTGQRVQVQRKELLRNSNGCGIAVEIIEDNKLTTICDQLMEMLDLNGVVNMEFFATDGGYRIIEINPRLSAGSIFTCMAGVNTVINAMKIADGEKCEFGEAAVGAHFAERYEAYRMD